MCVCVFVCRSKPKELKFFLKKEEKKLNFNFKFMKPLKHFRKTRNHLVLKFLLLFLTFWLVQESLSFPLTHFSMQICCNRGAWEEEEEEEFPVGLVIYDTISHECK